MRLIIFFLLISIGAFAQEPVYTPMKGNYKFKGIKADSLFLVPSFADTNSANATYIDQVAGAMIRCGNDFWMRNAAADAWLQNVNIGSGVSPVLSFVNEVFKKNGTDSVFYIVAPHDTFYAFKDKSFEDTLTNITYSNLLSYISAKQLIPNRKYKLTDFATTYKIYGTSVDTFGTNEPLILTASSDSTIYPQVYSPKYPNDIIYYSVIDSTILKPSILSKGVIVYREDTKYNLISHYDWRTILWKRYATITLPGAYWAFTEFNGIPNYIYKTTFENNCKNIILQPDCYNVTIESGCYSIKLNGNIGSPGAGVTINEGCHDITIDENCAKVSTVGSLYIGGIFIDSYCEYINIGKRSYNIAIGSTCYAIDLGLQQSDVNVPPLTKRRRLEKGFSNFECTTSINNKTLDLYNTIVCAVPSLLCNAAQFCGIVNVTSSNAVDTLKTLSALITSLTFQPIEIRPISGQKIVIQDSANGGDNILLGGNYLTIDGSKGEYAILYKRMQNTLSTQTSKFYLYTTNALLNDIASLDTTINLQKVTDNGNSTNQEININDNSLIIYNNTSSGKIKLTDNFDNINNNPGIFITDENDAKELFSLSSNIDNDRADMAIVGNINADDISTYFYNKGFSYYNNLPDSLLNGENRIFGDHINFIRYKYLPPSINRYDTIEILPIYTFNRPKTTYYYPATNGPNYKDTLATLRDIKNSTTNVNTTSFFTADLTSTDYNISSPGVYKCITSNANDLNLPDPSINICQRITVWNQTGGAVSVICPSASIKDQTNSTYNSIPNNTAVEFVSASSIWLKL